MGFSCFPSLTELGLAVSYHISLLKQKGLLRLGARQPRTIVEAPGPAPRAESNEVEVPLIGRIAAGVPLNAVELAEESFALSRRLVGYGEQAVQPSPHVERDPPLLVRDVGLDRLDDTQG